MRQRKLFCYEKNSEQYPAKIPFPGAICLLVRYRTLRRRRARSPTVWHPDPSTES